MRHISLCALLTLLSVSVNADFRFTHDGHTYDVITTGLSWAAASADAGTRSVEGATGYLARIDDMAENTAIFNQLTGNIPAGDFPSTIALDGGFGAYVWIGANDIGSEGDWLWTDNSAQFWSGDNTGSPVGGLYNNWGNNGVQNEPDDFGAGQDAAGISLDGWPLGVAGQWNDVSDVNTLYYIIEYDELDEAPFDCPADAFLFQRQPTDIFRVNLATGDSSEVASDIVPSGAQMNAIGYNVLDNCIWGSYRYAPTAGTISRVCGASYTRTDFVIDGLPGHYFIGDVNLDGELYLYNARATSYYVVDVDPNSDTYLTLLDTVPFASSSISDWAFNPLDGQIYAARDGIRPNGSTVHLYRIDPDTGTRTDLGALTPSSIQDGDPAWGAQYFDGTGILYLANNSGGNIYRIRDVANGNVEAELFADGPGSSANDGARCANNPIQLDFGDAPNSYGTLLASDGPRHEQRGPVADRLRLGPAVTSTEDDANAPLDGTGDAADDATGLVPGVDSSATSYSFDLTAYNVTGEEATLFAWIDFDQNGTFDQDESTSAPVPDTTDGLVTLTWVSIPADIGDGPTFMRLRITTDPAINTNTPTGPASDGEVEDHPVTIEEVIEPVAQSCPADAFLFQNQPTDIFSVNLATGASIEEASNITPSGVNVNAIGFNVTDGCIWGKLNDGTNAISRICDDGSWTRTNISIPGLSNSANAGDVSLDGLLYLYSSRSTTIYIVDVDTNSGTYLTLNTLATVSTQVSDWSFNPVDGQLYAVRDTTSGSTAVLYRFDPATGARTNLGTVVGGSGLQAGSSAFGGQYFDGAGTLYVSRNNDGKIYRLQDVANDNVSAEFFSAGPASSGNDGARCATSFIRLDFGDAPDSYGTTLAANGARHEQRGADSDWLRLGPAVSSTEDDANTPLDGSGDSFDDAVGLLPSIDSGATSFSFDLSAYNVSGQTATAFAWIDFDQNGTFDADEATSTAVADGTDGLVTLNWASIPAGMVGGPTFMRLRITTDPTITTSTPTGPASDGEVEDHVIDVGLSPSIGTAKQLAELTDNGDDNWSATFSIAVTNLGNEPLEDVQIVEDLAGFPDDTTVDSLGSAVMAVNAAYEPGVDDNLLMGTDTLAIGETKTVTLTITFDLDGNQPYTNQTLGSGTGVISGDPSSDPSDDGTDPDSDGDGVPGGPDEDDPTITTPTVTPVIGTAKQMADLTDNGNGSWTATFSIAVTNLGYEPLEDVQIVEDLADFPAGTTVDSLTSAVMAVNADYEPGVDDNLLMGTDTLAIGETKTVTLTITFTPDGTQPYANQAMGSATGVQSSDPTSDPSDNGTDPDNDGDGVPDEPGENDPTPTDPVITPVIGTAKALTSLVDNGDASWTATFSIAVTNLGNEPLDDVQISEDLVDFPVGTTVDSVMSAVMVVNPAYEPGVDNNLLSGTATLAIGETKAVTLVITFTPDGDQPYANLAIGSGIGIQSGDTASDPSDNGTDPDSDGDGDPGEPGENDPTPTTPTITPVIGTAKQLADLTDNGDATWTATFSIAVTNLGNEPLEDVQISEDLADFPVGTTLDDLTSAIMAVNAAYEPGFDNNLLAGTDTLAIGETKTVTLTISFELDGNQPYTNQAMGSGTGGQSGQTSSDPSDNGSNPDSDGDGNSNEPGENDPTPTSPVVTPVIGTAKQLVDLTDNGDASWSATFSIAVTNLGNEPLEDVQISEDLADFPVATTVDSLTSAVMAVNAAYEPGVDDNLLLGTDTLAIGETGTLTLTITFTPDGEQPYTNQAMGSGIGGQSGQSTSDPSDNGTDPDSDGDNNPDEPGENDPTPTMPTITPVIGTAKQMADLADNGDGSWTATFSIAVTNLGNEPLEDVQITEDLADFPTGTTVDNLFSAVMAANGSYEPGVDNDLLLGTDTLAIGETKGVTLVITFTPDGTQPYTNQALGSGNGVQSSDPTSDLSDNGTDPDEDGDGVPGGPGGNDPTPSDPVITPVIGTAKQMADLTDNGDGTWTVTFSLAVTNLGNEPLEDVQVTEDLADFPAGTAVDSLSSAVMAVNGSYDPGTDNDLLQGTDTLAIGETKTVTLAVTFTPDGNQPYINQALGSGNGIQSGDPTSDLSDNGTDPDNDGDGNPNEPGDNDPTPTTPTITPIIGTAKQLSNLADNGDATWTATFSIAVTNLGNEPLVDVQISEDLADFPVATTVDSLNSAVMAVNPAYDPGVDNNLLAGTDTLAIGETKTVMLVITFMPDGTQPYTNQAMGSGTGEQSEQVTSDPSDNGSDPDSDGDNNPDESGENDPTPTTPTITPVIGTAKQMADLTDNGNGSWTASFMITVTNLGNEPLEDIQITEDLADFPVTTTVDDLSSSDLSVNGSYDPGTDNDLLAGTDTLAIGETRTVTLVITFTPDGTQPYTNTALGTGTGTQTGGTSTDPSDNGTDPDEDGDGVPGGPGGDDPTPTDPVITPVIGTAKELTDLTDNANATWTATFLIAVTNLGNEPLEDVQIVEDLADFPVGTTVDDLSSSDLGVNGSYAPGADNNLLSGTDVLAIGETKTVTLVITFEPDGEQPYTNTAMGSGTGEQSEQVTSDPSDNGSDPDSDGDNNPNEPGENDPTPTDPVITPVIGTAKDLTDLTDNGNATWTATFSIAVTNLGNEPLNSVQITEDLADFPAGTTVDDLSSSDLTVNGSYDPGTDNDLLAGTDTLAIGETKAVTLVITFTPDGEQPYTNTAMGSGTGEQSRQVTSDPSDNGSDPDSDGDGNSNEPGENDPTPTSPVITPVIGTAKDLTDLTDNGNATWTATFSIAVTNLGNEPLHSVQITEDLADFPAGTTVDNLSSSGLTVNGGYAPGSDNNLLAGTDTDTLAIGETRTVTLTITFTPDGNQPYANQATGSAIGGQSGQTTSDPSDNGADPDSDGDNNPNEPGENDPTPTSPVITPVIGTAKQMVDLTDNGDGSWSATFSIAVTNLGNEPLEVVQIVEDLVDFPASTTVDSLSSSDLSVNGGYDPGSDNNLLAGTDTLAIGETKSVSLTIRITPQSSRRYSNQATGSATGGQSGDPTSDPSDNGANPDTDGDGNPDEPGENDATKIYVTVPIPVLSVPGLFSLMLLLGMFGFLALRRRRA